MARYKPVDQHLSKLLTVLFSEQILPGTFEYTLNWLVDHEIDLSVFDTHYYKDETGASAYYPGVLLKIVLLGYARVLTSSRTIERACRENVVLIALSGDTAPHSKTITSFVAKLPAEITSVFLDVLLVCAEQGLISKELFAIDGFKLRSNASRTWSGARADLTRKAEKMERAIAHMLDTHRRQDTGQNVDPLTKREQLQIETLTRNSRETREWLAVSPEKTNRRGEPLKSNLTDNEPLRDSQRLLPLRRWSHDESIEVFPRGSGACSSDGVGAFSGVRFGGGRSNRLRPRSNVRLRRWVRQSERDAGVRRGLTTAEGERIRVLERETRELRQANEILRKTSEYFAQAELDRPFKR